MFIIFFNKFYSRLLYFITNILSLRSQKKKQMQIYLFKSHIDSRYIHILIQYWFSLVHNFVIMCRNIPLNMLCVPFNSIDIINKYDYFRIGTIIILYLFNVV